MGKSGRKERSLKATVKMEFTKWVYDSFKGSQRLSAGKQLWTLCRLAWKARERVKKGLCLQYPAQGAFWRVFDCVVNKITHIIWNKGLFVNSKEAKVIGNKG
jgi:hypothetical protein